MCGSLEPCGSVNFLRLGRKVEVVMVHADVARLSERILLGCHEKALQTETRHAPSAFPGPQQTSAGHTLSSRRLPHGQHAEPTPLRSAWHR